MTEKLLWILDKEVEKPKGLMHTLVDKTARTDVFPATDESTRQIAAFVHSLGQKCDRVGWSALDLSAPNASELLEKIQHFCRENGWRGRGYYSRQCSDLNSDWYAFKMGVGEGYHGSEKAVDEGGNPLSVPILKAYHMKRSAPALLRGSFPLVSERFRDACIKHHVAGVDFCWAKDVGTYHAEQWFLMRVSSQIPEIACDRYLTYTELPNSYCTQSRAPGTPLYHRLLALGGFLPRLSEIFYDLNISLPDHYPRSAMPEAGFAHAYIFLNSFVRTSLLVHKDTAHMLLREKAVKPADLYPVPLFDEPPEGYVLQAMERLSFPSKEHVLRMARAYMVLKASPRPKQQATDSEALKALRAAKKERPSDFCKGMSKLRLEMLNGTAYGPLTSYYSIADGGHISDEYRLLPYADATSEHASLAVELKKEELLDEAIEGVVFASCANGDAVLLQPAGTVMRLSHEVPEAVETWPSAAQFFVDCLA